jgi:hypothetical protein
MLKAKLCGTVHQCIRVTESTLGEARLIQRPKSVRCDGCLLYADAIGCALSHTFHIGFPWVLKRIKAKYDRHQPVLDSQAGNIRKPHSAQSSQNLSSERRFIGMSPKLSTNLCKLEERYPGACLAYRGPLHPSSIFPTCQVESLEPALCMSPYGPEPYGARCQFFWAPTDPNLTPDIMPSRMSEYHVRYKMSGRMPDSVSGRMSEYMSDKCQTK